MCVLRIFHSCVIRSLASFLISFKYLVEGDCQRHALLTALEGQVRQQYDVSE